VENIPAERKHELLDRIRPQACPYCNSVWILIGHGWEPRYAVLANAVAMVLLVPRFKCLHCGHTMRVLPIELHNHCLHVAQTIVGMIAHKLACGKYSQKSRVPKYLQRHWFHLYEKRCQEFVDLHGVGDLCTFINRLPPFSVLFRNSYRTVWSHEPPTVWSGTHRTLPLIVCLDSS